MPRRHTRADAAVTSGAQTGAAAAAVTVTAVVVPDAEDASKFGGVRRWNGTEAADGSKTTPSIKDEKGADEKPVLARATVVAAAAPDANTKRTRRNKQSASSTKKGDDVKPVLAPATTKLVPDANVSAGHGHVRGEKRLGILLVLFVLVFAAVGQLFITEAPAQPVSSHRVFYIEELAAMPESMAEGLFWENLQRFKRRR